MGKKTITHLGLRMFSMFNDVGPTRLKLARSKADFLEFFNDRRELKMLKQAQEFVLVLRVRKEYDRENISFMQLAAFFCTQLYVSVYYRCNNYVDSEV